MSSGPRRYRGSRNTSNLSVYANFQEIINHFLLMSPFPSTSSGESL